MNDETLRRMGMGSLASDAKTTEKKRPFVTDAEREAYASIGTSPSASRDARVKIRSASGPDAAVGWIKLAVICCIVLVVALALIALAKWWFLLRR